MTTMTMAMTTMKMALMTIVAMVETTITRAIERAMWMMVERKRKRPKQPMATMQRVVAVCSTAEEMTAAAAKEANQRGGTSTAATCLWAPFPMKIEGGG